MASFCYSETMLSWTLYPVFVGTVVSIAGLSQIALKKPTTGTIPRTLSELAAAEEQLLRHFRNILVFCGTLFAITLFGFIVPRIHHAPLVTLFGALMIGGELLAAVIPARGRTVATHLLLAQSMAIGMFGLGVLFALNLTGTFSALATALVVSMFVFALLTVIDKRHYVVFELAFIFASHFSIILAALALK